MNPIWSEAVASHEANYTNLHPGPYLFHVIASNSDGLWNGTELEVPFTIEPVFWSTWWFRTTYVAVILLSVWCAYRYRLHRLAKQYSIRLEERVSERTRIARELHDTLLQSFQGLLLVLQSGINLLPDRPDVARARERLQGAIDQAEQAITERRDAVQGLRASTLETNDLAATLNALAAELAANQGGQNSPVFGVQVEGASRDLHPILRDDVYRIAGEALRNAFLHAQASRIEVDIRYGTERFRVRIRDDGKGIESQIVTNKGRTGHWGLRGMHERAKLVGGNLAVWSKPDSGTEIELIIPASTAYGKSTTERPGSPERELQ